MPERVKLLLICLADWFDDTIVGHHLYGKRGGLCQLIATSPWWGEDDAEWRKMH